jgi:hypothetical protein
MADKGQCLAGHGSQGQGNEGMGEGLQDEITHQAGSQKKTERIRGSGRYEENPPDKEHEKQAHHPRRPHQAVFFGKYGEYEIVIRQGQEIPLQAFAHAHPQNPPVCNGDQGLHDLIILPQHIELFSPQQGIKTFQTFPSIRPLPERKPDQRGTQNPQQDQLAKGNTRQDEQQEGGKDQQQRRA